MTRPRGRQNPSALQAPKLAAHHSQVDADTTSPLLVSKAKGGTTRAPLLLPCPKLIGSQVVIAIKCFPSYNFESGEGSGAVMAFVEIDTRPILIKKTQWSLGLCIGIDDKQSATLPRSVRGVVNMHRSCRSLKVARSSYIAT